MPITPYPNGVSSFGVPVFPGVPVTTGSYFFVCNASGANGSNGNPGSPTQPFLTIDYAVGRCTANKGDVIIAMPGHNELVSAAAGLVFNIAGVTLVGLGNGEKQARITLDTIITADVDIDAANVTITGMRFVAGFADVTAAIDVNATDFTLRGCRLTGDNAGLNAVVWVVDAAAAASDRITIEDCYVCDVDAANTHFVNFAGTGTGHIVRRNTLIGDWGTMALGGAGVITFANISDNYISNKASDTDSCINFAATATGICMNNRACGGAAQANGITAQGMAKCENYYGVLAEDLNGILEPIAT